ncbi:hypothetical protein [Deinococcus multiflagellatus]|uniref:Uncharacterized protein n=1 Tax=Deinococcus multiflagellatus TaxID=1656887 RepID=A0ABW1ZMY2_9DEIO
MTLPTPFLPSTLLAPLHALEQSYLKQVGPARPGQPPHLDPYPADAPLHPDWAALDQPEAASFWARLGTLLRLAATPLRVEPHATYNPHRAYPSPRALYAAHVVLQTAQGRWLLDPHRAQLRRLTHAAFTPPRRPPCTCWATCPPCPTVTAPCAPRWSRWKPGTCWAPCGTWAVAWACA